mmetsp:Transcript_28347/g.49889  ORF Transcript_28347/g.49889 Transcript_28347/m.49889 type:complete len:252 (+) Transcript_28347:20-775(+)|eukprot:CAMPEP_0197521708 /NCGR_PEP_ID=MMETSP1318-20131121/6952_1 /TAXON_ID=552666 /ORGANISM="Partenskyella glossopodia, Strain RCC365" /LENGTH=251 /DNA_ID=CAMNT_0043073813 /DNA_START=20 /DNA_END=775 /DNA_ORIENTATION=-
MAPLSKALCLGAVALAAVTFVSLRGSSPQLSHGVASRTSFRLPTSLPSRTSVCASKDTRLSPAKNALAGLALAGAGTLAALHGAPAHADISGLTKCSESAAFKKRQTKEIKSLEKQLKKTPEGTAGALELKNRIDRTNRRFAAYGKTSLLCGPDGLPHLIVGAEFRGHEGEFVIPGLGFLYINGWIGWAGRKYLRGNRNENSKPTEGEIILDVPRMSKAILSGGAWPFEAWKEYQSGELVAKSGDVTVSAK